ncbi:MAG TPA: CHAT domain-containing protein [Pyrinomonadaceae bacterium]|jgi:CHAT domain-containing protein/tetratricopeptide (TPR) repeat protein
MIRLFITPTLRRRFAGAVSLRSAHLPSILLVALVACAAPSSPSSIKAFQGVPAVPATGEDVRTLRPGEVIRQSMKGDELHRFRLALLPKQYVHVVVEQQGIDVVVKLLDPGGQLIVRMDSPNGLRGPEAVSAVAQAAGSYTIEISTNKTQPLGSYELKVEGPREAVAADDARLAAERHFMTAQRLQETEETREAAIEQYKKAVDLWREIGDARLEGYALCNLGRIQSALGKLTEAVDYFKQARERLGDAQDIAGQAFVLNEMGAAQRDLGNPLQAIDSYRESLELRSSIGDEWGQAQLRNNIGLVYSKMGQPQKALENLAPALSFWREVGVRRMEMNTLNNIAKVQADMGSLLTASQQFESILAYCRETGDRYLEPFVRNSLGWIYDTWAEPQEALRQYELALALFREKKNKEGRVVGDKEREAVVLDNIGMVYAGLGDAQEALKYFQDALKLRQQLNEPAGEAVTRSNTGYAQMLLGNYQESLKHLTRALTLSQTSHNKTFEAYTRVRIGQVHVSLGEMTKALEYYKQALVIQQEIEDPRGQAITLDQMGKVYALLGDESKARESYDRALKAWREVGDRQGEALSLYGIALVERAQHHLPAARDRIEEAIGIIESQRSKMNSHQLRMTYFAQKQDFYALAISIRMRLYDLNRSTTDLYAALYANERARARDLLDLLTEAHAGLNKGMSPQDAERTRRLEQEIGALTQSWLQLRNLQRAGDAAAVEEKLNARVAELEKLQTQIKLAKPSYAALRQPRPLHPQEIQRLLDDDTLLLQYALDDERSYLWAVTRKEVVAYYLPGRAEIEKTAGLVRQALTAYEPPRPGESRLEYLTRLRKAAVEYRQLAVELSRKVIAPASAHLSRKRLVIIADGALQYIPFEALPVTTGQGRPTADAAAPTHLISQHEVVYQPSASTLALLRDTPRRKATKTVAVLADPVFDNHDERVRASVKGQNGAALSRARSFELDRTLRDVGDIGLESAAFRLERLRYTEEEANAITAAAPPGSWMKAIGFQASRATVMSQALSQFGIVHFATHGILNDKHPELSGIVLSMIKEDGQPADGYLRLGDIYNLELPVELVVLSACRTGIGKQVRGEGLIGLTRGFMYAGAARVVASLWKVDDEATAELMKRFYRCMLERKMPAAAALREAKIEMSASERWRAPYYWAGFILQGDWQ